MAKNRKSSKKEKQPSTEASPAFKSHPSHAELYALGKSLREKSPRSAHADWKAPHDRPDPLHLLEESSKGRIPELIPIRYGRMLQTPFTFYRGAALNMAADLRSRRQPACACRRAATAICSTSASSQRRNGA